MIWGIAMANDVCNLELVSRHGHTVFDKIILGHYDFGMLVHELESSGLMVCYMSCDTEDGDFERTFTVNAPISSGIDLDMLRNRVNDALIRSWKGVGYR